MADDFDNFLTAALAPPDRQPDRWFVLRMQVAIKLEERLSAQRSALVRQLLTQLVALTAVAAALWWIGRAAPVASRLAESPAIGLAILLVSFAGLVGLLGQRSDAGQLRAR